MLWLTGRRTSAPTSHTVPHHEEEGAGAGGGAGWLPIRSPQDSFVISMKKSFLCQ